ncbi:MAG TPA: type VI secretion system lipoprotein TssJ [Rhodothermales bacterium]|nr:type VI secretion system lipoprotein TssJ [Rhodothermales bacterium]
MTRLSRPALLLLTLVALAAAGCGGGRAVIEGAPAVPDGPTRAVVFTMTLRGTADMNRGNAVGVRVYTLRGTSGLGRATLPDLWADDAAALGGDVIRREEARLFPGDESQVRLEVAPEATAIAVVANLRDPAGRGWQHVFPVSELRGAEATVSIGADRVTIAGQ